MTSGSLQEKNGFYYAVLNLKDDTGKRKQKWIGTELPIRGNKKRAEKILRELLEQYDNNDITSTSKKILFTKFIQMWMDINKAKLQTTTYDGYVHIFNKHIKPYFNELGIFLQDVKPVHIQKYYNDKQNEGLSPNTVIKHHGIIRTAMQYAVKNKIIKENIVDFVDKPKKQKFTGGYYNQDELNSLFKICKGESIDTVILLTAYYGLRRSEVLGLQWNAIDFVNKSISIQHKCVRSFDEEGKVTFSLEDELKSKSSYRTLPLGDEIAEHLQRVKAQQEQNKKLCKDCYCKDYTNYICVDALGQLLKPDYITHKFMKVLKHNNLRKIRFHDLRHSCATLLLSLGFSMKEIQEWLGHANLQTTANIYAHVDFNKKVNMINTVSSSLKF